MSTSNTVIVPINEDGTVVSFEQGHTVIIANSVTQIGGGSGNFDPTLYYTKTATDALLATKANSPIVVNDITDFDGTVMAGGTF